MRMNPRVGPVVLIAVLFTSTAMAAQTATGDDTSTEMRRLAGVWQEVARQRDGQLAPTAQLGVLTQTENGAVTQRLGDRIVYQGRVSIDATRVPKAIDYLETASPNPAAAPGETRRGIYEINGDTMLICLAAPGADRPTALNGGAGTGCILFTYRRRE